MCIIHFDKKMTEHSMRLLGKVNPHEQRQEAKSTDKHSSSRKSGSFPAPLTLITIFKRYLIVRNNPFSISASWFFSRDF